MGNESSINNLQFYDTNSNKIDIISFDESKTINDINIIITVDKKEMFDINFLFSSISDVNGLSLTIPSVTSMNSKIIYSFNLSSEQQDQTSLHNNSNIEMTDESNESSLIASLKHIHYQNILLRSIIDIINSYYDHYIKAEDKASEIDNVLDDLPESPREMNIEELPPQSHRNNQIQENNNIPHLQIEKEKKINVISSTNPNIFLFEPTEPIGPINEKKPSFLFCEIEENFLYLSGYKFASDTKQLKKNNITHIINAAGSNCANVSTEIKYLTLNLKDNTKENIECVFYMCIDFILKAKEQNGKVLIHCYQGRSRSVAIAMAYYIYKYKTSVEKTLALIQSKRPRADPNLGFIIQLELFYRRIINEKNYNFCVFAISSFSENQPDIIVARLIYSSLSNYSEMSAARALMLDRRGMFLICDAKKVFIVIGSDLIAENKEQYMTFVTQYIEILKKNENIAKGEIQIEKMNMISKECMTLIEENKIKIIFGITEVDYYVNISEQLKFYEIRNKKEKENEEQIQKRIQFETNVKKAFFFYPREEPFKVLDLDLISDNDFIVACVHNGKCPIMHIWKGKSCTYSKEELDQYVQFIKLCFYTFLDIEAPLEPQEIIEVNEIPYKESDEFMMLMW